MSNLMRLPHEISLWEDVLTVVDNDGNEYSGFVDISKIQVSAQYYKEKKLCVISSDKIESPTHVVDPALVRKTDGTSTLTFSIYAKYWDEESGELVDNPFIQYLTNERKVKLKYFPNGELKWLDLVIKKIDESSENYKFTYTATDLFINELSKSGYNLEFDMELENNQGPVNELASKVLAGTDWVVGADSELLQQTTTEALYEIVLTKGITPINIFSGKEEKPIPAKEKIYAFYSTVTNKTYDYFQFIYNENGIYTADENGILYNAGNYYAVLSESDLPYDTYTYKNDYRGERYVRSPKTVYDETIGRYVNVYNNGTRYGYSDDKYISPALVNNLITNGSHIISNTGWFQQETTEVKTEMLPTYKEVTYYEDRIFGLEFVKNANNTFIVNSGFKDNVSKIGSIAKNDKFIFRVKGGLPVTVNNITSSLDMGNSRFEVEVAAYKINEDSGAIEKISGTTLFSGQATLKDSDGYYYTNEMSANRAVSQEELTDVLSQRYGIFITTTGNNGTYYIQEVELFASVKDKNGHIILPNGNLLSGNQILSSTPVAYVDTTYYYYDPNSEVNKKATEPTQMEYEYVGKRALESYIPTYVANFEKIRGITAKETNRFNLLQSLSETFECWCRFDVLHKENGEIALGRDVAQTILSSEGLGSNGIFYTAGTPTSYEALSIVANSIETVPDQYKQQKFVTFHKRVGQQKSVGFTYGINLKSVSRSLDSNDIATKLIVKNNSNKYADIGSCSIARANVNPSGENFILDFSHYVRQGLMNYTNIQNDLYSTVSSRGWIGLYTRLKNLNNSRDSLVAKQSSLVAELSKHKSDYESSSLLYDSANKEFSEQIRYYHSLTGWIYGEIEKELEKIKNDTTDEAEETRKNLQGWLDDKKVIATVTNIERLREEQKKHDAVCVKAKASLDEIEENINNIEGQLDNIKAQKTELLSKFEKKYGRFLQEASWISDDHTDDNLYYFDAETTLHNSAQPKVSYTINIVELSQLEGYEGYNFELGDITYVQDTDFFGWTYENGFKTPYKEEIVITEMTTYFNSPEKNVLKAKNYRDQFEDLFQRMAASSQQLQFHSGAYDRAADAVSSDGNIMPQALSDAFTNNAYVLSNIANQSVKWDEYGITTTDTTNPADIVRVTSGGIYLTEDGGRNWTTGISASGINAKTITTGQLDTGAVTIMSGDQTAFRWDDSGINAFKEVPDGEGGYQRSSQTYVRFDEHGLYGIDGQANFDPKEVGVNGNTGIDRINDEAKFALTWDGFVLNSSDSSDKTAKVRISDKDDFQILDDKNEERLRIGRLTGSNSAGMQVNVDAEGQRPVVIGDTGFRDTEHGKLVFRAGGDFSEKEDAAPFRVYEDGFFYAKNAQIGGSLTAAQLRDIEIDISYISGGSGTHAILLCSPTIKQDEINAIQWKSGNEVLKDEDNNDLSLKLGYDEVSKLQSISNPLPITVTAWVSKFEAEGEEEDTPEEIDYELTLPLDDIFKTNIEYAVTESNKIPEGDVEWSDSLPEEIAPGSYVWTRFGNIFLDGSTNYRYEVAYQGKDGSGQFTSIVFKRTINNIAPDAPSGGTYQKPVPEGWSDGILSEGGPYVWSSQAVFKLDGTKPVWSEPILMRDVSGKFDVQYSDEITQPHNPSIEPNKWYDANLTNTDLSTAIWMATRSSDDGGATWSVWTITRVRGEQGPQGPKGDKGDAGTGINVKATASDCKEIGDAYVNADGDLMILTSINPSEFTNGGKIKGPAGETTYFHVAYANSADGSKDFSTSNYNNKIYIGHYTDTIEADSQNYRDYKWTKWKGDDGENGRGISTVVEYYAAHSSNSVLPTVWYTSPPVLDATNKYLWNYEEIFYTDGTSAETAPAVIGVFGEDGEDGRGISYIIEYYALSTSQTTVTGNWDTKIPTLTSTNKYLWNKEYILYTDNSVSESNPVIIGIYGDKGDKGDKGDTGNNGNNGDTKSTAYAYCLTSTSSISSKPSGTPSQSGTVINTWYLIEPSESSMTSTEAYLFRSEGVKTISGVDNSTSYSDWQDAVLYKAYNNVSVPYDNYAEYLKITNFGESGLYYKNKQLYINADHIKVTSDGSGSTGDVVFEAVGSSKTVSIAGWTVSNSALYTSNNTLYLGTTGIEASIGGTKRTGLVFKAGSNFGVTSDGHLYATGATITGNITAKGGSFIGAVNIAQTGSLTMDNSSGWGKTTLSRDQLKIETNAGSINEGTYTLAWGAVGRALKLVDSEYIGLQKAGIMCAGSKVTSSNKGGKQTAGNSNFWVSVGINAQYLHFVDGICIDASSSKPTLGSGQIALNF